MAVPGFWLLATTGMRISNEVRALSHKAAERAELSRLSGDIAKVLEARRERERLAASVEAARRIAEETSKSWLDRGEVPVGKFREEQKRARAQQYRDQVSVKLAKDRERLARKNAATPQEIGPTSERVAKEETGAVTKLPTPIRDDGTRLGARTHAVQAPYERYQNVLPQDLLAAAVQAVTDILTAESGPKVTASYDGVPVTSFGARHGGVQDYVREKTALVDEMRATLDREFLEVIDWVITSTVIKPSGESMTLADVGRKVSPWQPGKSGEKDTAVGFGRMYQTLVRLREFYALQGALGKQTTPPSPAEVRRLLTAGAARLQRHREQYGRHLENEEKKSRMQGGGR